MRRAAATLLAGLVWLAASATTAGVGGQRPQQPAPVFRTGVDAVTLDVSVLDADRRPVRGLAKEDFTVLEDGKVQAITAFDAVEEPDQLEDVPVAPWVREVSADVQKNTDIAARRIVAVVMDDATPMPAPDVMLARAAARDAINALGPGELGCVVFALDQKSGQEFTTDRKRLLAAVDRFNGAVTSAAQSSGTFDITALTLYARAIDVLRGLADALATLPDRRKAILWISDGVPLDWTEGAPSIPAGMDKQGGFQQIVASLKAVLAAAGRANVNIYSLDPGGLRAPEAFQGFFGGHELIGNPHLLNREFLHTVARSTGGFAITDTNDPRPSIRQLLRENASYYLLGYMPTNARANGQFRKIDVRVNRPGATVRARFGYYEPPPSKAKQPASAPAAVDVALAGVLPKTDLTMQVWAAPFGVAGRRNANVVVTTGIRQQAPRRATRVVQEIDLQIAAYGEDGKRRASKREKVPVTLNRPGTSLILGYEVLSWIELPPGRYQLRLAAESTLHGIRLAPNAPEVAMVAPGEETAPRSGSVYCDLEVPDFAGSALALSGVALAVSPPVVSGPPGALKSRLPLVPTSLREFSRDDQVSAFVQVWQGRQHPPAPVTVTLRLANARGQTVQEKSETLDTGRFAGTDGTGYTFDVPVAQLAPGLHLLTVEAQAGKAASRRDVRISVLR
jgi:VWFA-related protein